MKTRTGGVLLDFSLLHLSWSIRAAVTNHHRLSDSNNKHCFSQLQPLQGDEVPGRWPLGKFHPRPAGVFVVASQSGQLRGSMFLYLLQEH